jgi:hypothetical protein
MLMVDLAVGTPEVGAVNFNVLHTLLHAILRRLNIVDVQADLNDFDGDSLVLPVLITNKNNHCFTKWDENERNY